MRKKICMSEQTFFDHLLKLPRRQLIDMVIDITTSQKNIPLHVWSKKIHVLYTYHNQKRQMNARLAKCSYL